MRELTDVDFPEAEQIRVVLDNLSTHLDRLALSSLSSLRSATGAALARVPLCPQARQLVEHGRDRDRSTAEPMPGQTHRQSPAVENLRSPPGNDSAMPRATASNGCSQPRKPAPNRAAPILSQTPVPDLRAESHNHCAAVPGQSGEGFPADCRRRGAHQPDGIGECRHPSGGELGNRLLSAHLPGGRMSRGDSDE